jgi:hypothetical protein
VQVKAAAICRNSVRHPGSWDRAARGVAEVGPLQCGRVKDVEISKAHCRSKMIERNLKIIKLSDKI